MQTRMMDIDIFCVSLTLSAEKHGQMVSSPSVLLMCKKHLSRYLAGPAPDHSTYSSSSTSSDDEYNCDFNIQWIFHFECFHYMKNVYIKEFSAYCIQTSDYFTCHIKCTQAINDADEIAKAAFE